jgi:uncharacterized protein
LVGLLSNQVNNKLNHGEDMKKCPSCEVVMNEVTKAGVLIDVCPKCMGIWLDKGELEKIITQTDAYNSRFYNENQHENDDDDDSGHHDRHHDRFNGKVYYDKNGKPIRKRGGLGDILGGLFD